MNEDDEVIIRETAEKLQYLDPDDPVRRSLLERLADLFLCRHSREKHYRKRVKKVIGRIAY
jgi:hypothetical protein